MPLAIDEIYVHQPVDEAAFPIRAATPQAPRDADLPQARLQPMSYHSMPVAVRQPAWSMRAPSRRSSPLVMLPFLLLTGLFVFVEIYV